MTETVGLAGMMIAALMMIVGGVGTILWELHGWFDFVLAILMIVLGAGLIGASLVAVVLL